MHRRAFLSGVIGAGLLPLADALAAGESKGYAPTQGTLRINYYHQWQPISYSDEGKAAQGMLISVLDAVLDDRMGVDVIHTGLPWKRAQYDVKMGQADALCAFPSPARKDYLLFTNESSFELEVVFFCRKDSLASEVLRASSSFEDLYPLKFGDLLANDWAKQKLKDHSNVTFAPNLLELLKSLIHNRIEVVMAPDHIGRFLLSQLEGADDIIYQRKGYIGRRTPMHLGVRKDYPGVIRFIERFDRVMADFKKSGGRDEVINKFFLA